MVARIPGRLSRWIGKRYDALEERLSKSIWLKWLYVLMRGTRQTAGWSYEFGRSWLLSRDYRLLIGGVPAILLALPLTLCLARIPFHSDTAKARHYRQAATDAWEQGEFDAARLYYRKIQQIGVSVETALFQTALSADEEGDVDAAFQQMKEVVDQYDFVPAKLWMVQTLLFGKLKHPPADADRICEEHLASILALDPNNPTARMLNATRYQRQGDLLAALNEIKPIAREYPPANLLISQIQQQRRDFGEAIAALGSSLEYFQSRYDSGVVLDSSEYQTWIRALSMANEHRRMQEVAEQALLVYPENRSLRRYIIEIFSFAGDRLVNEYGKTSQRAELLKRAWELDPSNEATLERLATLINDRQVGPEIREFFAKQSDTVPANVHGALAVAACARGDYVAARPHFAKVVEALPESAEAANNLAWVLIHGDPIEAEQALEMAERAVALNPAASAFRETRGQIHLKLGNWEQAIADLEHALNGLPSEAVTIHRSLAEAYEATGAKTLANEHRTLASIGGSGTGITFGTSGEQGTFGRQPRID